jgi:ZIP family zinc transporter
MSPFLAAVLASLCAGAATGVGALPALFAKSFSDRSRDILLGFAAGVMLAAACFSLIIPGIAAAEALGDSEFMAAGKAACGILLGGFFIRGAHALIPHEHFVKGEEGTDRLHARKLRRIWLFVLAITLHNFPEGMAVGVGYGAGDFTSGMAIALGIGLQNLPEGFAVAMALLGTGRYSTWTAIGLALATGLVEPIGGAFGAGLVGLGPALLPWGLTASGGAMLFVISNEVIPETHANGFEKSATTGLLAGFCVMMFLDVTLG